MRRFARPFAFLCGSTWLLTGLAHASPWRVGGDAHGQDCADLIHDDRDDSLAARVLASRPIHWAAPQHGKARAHHSETLKILAVNDFHGQIGAGRTVAGRPVGGAAVLAAYLKAASVGLENRTLIVHAGDHVGASPPSSALLQDEPAITFLNLMGNRFCRTRSVRPHEKCNLVGTLGNHEFDEGQAELLRLIRGGNHENGPFLAEQWRGASFPYVSANVLVEATREPLLQPYVIRRLGTSQVAVIGAVLRDTPSIVTPTGVAGLSFIDEAEAINRSVKQLRKRGIRAIIVSIHQGARQSSYLGPTDLSASPPDGRDLLDIIHHLDGEVDIVISGHAHAFTNALIDNAAGKPMLVTQAFSSGTAFANIDLTIDTRIGDIVAKSAAIVTTFADEGPGLLPDPRVARMVAEAEALVEPLVAHVVGSAATAITRTQNAAGESALGNWIADAQRAAMATDFAFMNPGGIRADLDAGDVTWGDLFTIQPFGNSLVKMNVTGQEIYDLLEQQWLEQPFPRILQVSGLSYTWDPSAAVGTRVIEVRRDGQAITRDATYSITINSFIAAGGDNFTVLSNGRDRIGGPIDLDALIEFIDDAGGSIAAAIEGRIVTLGP